MFIYKLAFKIKWAEASLFPSPSWGFLVVTIIFLMLTSFLLAPLRAPGILTTYSLSSTTVKAKWNHLLDGDFQGEPIGYIITFQQVESESDRIVVRVNYTTNTTTLTNLVVFTMYVINVSAVSSGGIGPANTAKVRTDASGRKI